MSLGNALNCYHHFGAPGGCVGPQTRFTETVACVLTALCSCVLGPGHVFAGTALRVAVLQEDQHLPLMLQPPKVCVCV